MSAFPETSMSLLAKIASEQTGVEEAAWVRFFELYRPAMLKFAEDAGGAEESEDIVQDVFVKLVEIFRTGQGHAPEKGRFRSYLATLIRRELVNRWRAARVRHAKDRVSIDGVELAVPPEAAVLLDMKWRLARHEAAVHHVLTRTALSARSKAVYRAYMLEGRSIDEVARLFGIPNNGVSQIKTRVEKMIAAIEAEFAD